MTINSATGAFSGIGFAVPSDAIIRELATLTKKVELSMIHQLQITGGKITPDLAQSAGLPRNYKRADCVRSVQGGSPAEKAGLQAVTQSDTSTTQHIGDIITGVDGHPLRSIDDLINYIDLHKSIGDNVGLTVNRHGQIMNLNLVLQARPPSLGNQTAQESILP